MGANLTWSLLEKAIDETGVGVVLTNPRLEDNPIIYVNKGFEEVTGYSKEEVLGKNCRLLQGPLTRQEDIEAIRLTIMEKRSCEVEILNYKKDGQIFWNELHVTPLFDKDGQLEYFVGIQKDITSKKNTEEIQKLYEKVFHNTLQGVIITDASTNIVHVNDAFTNITGYSAQEAIGKRPAILSSGKQSTKFYEKLWQELNDNGQWEGEIWNRRKNGEIYPEFLNISEVRNHNGEITNYVSIFTDITESKNREKQLATMSMHDALTGIANRRAFDGYLSEKWCLLKEIQEPISLILIDIDYFKCYNDFYGHVKGDQALKITAQQITNSIDGNTALPVRYGGEEFAVVLPQYDLDEACSVANRILQNIKQAAIPHEKSPVKNILSISCGVACIIPNNDNDIQTLIHYADIALYKAKENGRNRVEAYYST